MLSYGLLKNHAGILLIGDYTSLRWLHEVIHDVNDRSPLVKDKEGMFRTMCVKPMNSSAKFSSHPSITKKLASATA